jgi:hypothetical protein
MQIRGVCDEIPDFVRARSEKNLLTIGRPAWVTRILAWDVLPGRDASSIRRDRRKNSIGDLFLGRAI